MENFNLINDNEFNLFNDKSNDLINKNVNNNNNSLCINCNIQMNSNINNSYLCNICGYIKKTITENKEYEASLENYNTSNLCHIPIKCVGKTSYKYQQYLRNNTSQYKTVQEKTIKKKLNKLNFNTDNILIPKNIITNVLEHYKKIRNTNEVYRGDILTGILGSLIYYECLNAGIARKHTEVSKWCKIDVHNLSKGDKIIRKLNEDKILNIAITTNSQYYYIDSYLLRLNIDDKYKNFLYELFDIINNKKIANINARTSTKASSIIYLLTISENLNITVEQISSEFDISISTFKSFYNDILKEKEKIKDVLNKYNIIIQTKIPRRKRIKKEIINAD